MDLQDADQSAPNYNEPAGVRALSVRNDCPATARSHANIDNDARRHQGSLDSSTTGTDNQTETGYQGPTQIPQRKDSKGSADQRAHQEQSTRTTKEYGQG